MSKLTVRELYQQLKPFVQICPDEEVLVQVSTRFGTRDPVYPISVDRNDSSGREIVIGCITPAADDFHSRRK